MDDPDYQYLPDYVSDDEGNSGEKERIPDYIKYGCWKNYAGNRRKVDCWVNCGDQITIHSFHAGHIRAENEGGEMRVENFRPICGRCNSSIGTKHMHDFVVIHGLKSIPGYLPETRVSYENADKVPEVVKRRVWHDISNQLDSSGRPKNSIITDCAVIGCKNSVHFLQAKYAFYKMFGEGTIQNVKPVCSTCKKAMKVSTIEYFEEFREYIFKESVKRPHKQAKIKPRKRQKINL